MSNDETLADLLDKHLVAAQMGESRLAKLANGAVDIPQFLHRSTVRNWRIGTSKRAKDWRQLTAMAMALHLNATETDQLLRSGGCSTLRDLIGSASEEDAKFLQNWKDAAQEPVHQIGNMTAERGVSTAQQMNAPANYGDVSPQNLPASHSLGLSINKGSQAQTPTLVTALAASSAGATSTALSSTALPSTIIYPVEEPTHTQLQDRAQDLESIHAVNPNGSRKFVMLFGLLFSSLVVVGLTFARGAIQEFFNPPAASSDSIGLSNGDFSDGLTGWSMYVNDSAEARFSVEDESLRADILRQGDDDWHVQLFQPRLDVVAEKVYIVRFRVRGNSANEIVADVTRTDDPKTSIGVSGASREHLAISDEWQTFVIEFVATETIQADEGGARILFDLGSVSPGTVWLDDVEFFAR